MSEYDMSGIWGAVGTGIGLGMLAGVTIKTMSMIDQGFKVNKGNIHKGHWQEDYYNIKRRK